MGLLNGAVLLQSARGLRVSALRTWRVRQPKAQQRVGQLRVHRLMPLMPGRAHATRRTRPLRGRMDRRELLLPSEARMDPKRDALEWRMKRLRDPDWMAPQANP